MIAINSFITELFFDVPQHRDNWVLIENFNNHLLNIINISVNHSNGSTDADSLLESNWSMHLITFINIFPENFHFKLNITWSTLFICWFTEEAALKAGSVDEADIERRVLTAGWNNFFFIISALNLSIDDVECLRNNFLCFDKQFLNVTKWDQSHCISVKISCSWESCCWYLY